MKTHKRLSIFKPGRFTALSGETIAFSAADLQATAAAYDPEKHEAPLVVGHPKMDTPAYGWAQSLDFTQNLLQAIPHRVGTEFAEWVNAGHFGKISAAFYPPDSPNNPVPGVYYLRHIGFLGAQPPAVKGLPTPEFSDGSSEIQHFVFAAGEDFITLEFAEETHAMTEEEKQHLAQQQAALIAKQAELDAKEAEFAERDTQLKQDQATLDQQQQQAHQQQLTEFAEGLIKTGQLLPGHKLGAVAFMSTLKQPEPIEFGEGVDKKQVATLDWFQGFLQSLPKQVEFSELTPPGEPEQQATEFAAPPGYVVEAAGMENYQKILNYQQQHSCDYNTAINALGL